MILIKIVTITKLVIITYINKTFRQVLEYTSKNSVQLLGSKQVLIMCRELIQTVFFWFYNIPNQVT